MQKYTINKIPDIYLDDKVVEKGQIEEIEFDTYDYVNKQNVKSKLYVYLPYSYDINNKNYNVLYLLHGAAADEGYWLACGKYSGYHTTKTKILLDNMNYHKLINDTIVVTPTENINGTNYFHLELINYIMPVVETKYNTFANLRGKNIKDVIPSDFISSRAHRAYAGLSLGSMIAWSIISYDLEYFGYFGFYSGGVWSQKGLLEKAITIINQKDYNIKYAFHSCGDMDSMYQDHIDCYNKINQNTSNKLVDWVNTCFITKPNFTHNYDAWIVDLYNSLGYFFFK